MTRIEGETLIGRPPVIVFDFVADQRNEPKFNPRMVRAEMISDPPIGNGSRFVATMKSVGRSADMVIEFTSLERPLRLGSKTRMSWIDIEGGLTFEPHPCRNTDALVMGGPTQAVHAAHKPDHLADGQA